MSKDKEPESLKLSENDNLELLITQRKLDAANERILELEDEFNTAELCWTDALDLEEKHRKKLDAANERILELEETHRIQLAGISAISLCNTEKSLSLNLIEKDNPYWTPAFGDVVDCVLREIKLIKQHIGDEQ